MYGPIPQSVEPSHHCGSKARRKYLAHQTVISGVQGHHLQIMAYMLHWISFTIVIGKGQLVEVFGYLCALFIIEKRQSGCSLECSAHCIQGHA